MRDFQFYVTDDRYSVPSFLLVTVMDEEGARRIARRMLAEPHHRAVAVWDQNGKLFTMRRPEDIIRSGHPSASPPPAGP